MQYISAAAVIWNQDLEMFPLTCLALEMVRCENQWDSLCVESLNLSFNGVQFTCVINPFYICIFHVYLKSIHWIILQLFSETSLTFVFHDANKSPVILLGCAQLSLCYCILHILPMYIMPLPPKSYSGPSAKQYHVLFCGFGLYSLASVHFLWQLLFINPICLWL